MLHLRVVLIPSCSTGDRSQLTSPLPSSPAGKPGAEEDNKEDRGRGGEMEGVKQREERSSSGNVNQRLFPQARCQSAWLPSVVSVILQLLLKLL